MILIVVKFPVRSELTDEFIEAVGPFTSVTRIEPGNKWPEWPRGIEDPNEFVLAEVFDDDAVEAHVAFNHFGAGLETVCPFLTTTPRIILHAVDGDDWGAMEELRTD